MARTNGRLRDFIPIIVASFPRKSLSQKHVLAAQRNDVAARLTQASAEATHRGDGLVKEHSLASSE